MHYVRFFSKNVFKVRFSIFSWFLFLWLFRRLWALCVSSRLCSFLCPETTRDLCVTATNLHRVRPNGPHWHARLHMHVHTTLQSQSLQDVAAAAGGAMLPTFWVASFLAWWACRTATASSTCANRTANMKNEPVQNVNDCLFRVPRWRSTFERRDSCDSSMCSSSELSISSNMPVIFPARLACMAWISGNRRSPVGGERMSECKWSK